MAGFTGAPSVWARGKFLVSSSPYEDAHYIFDRAHKHFSLGPIFGNAQMSVRGDCQRFAFATVYWSGYTNPPVRSRLFSMAIPPYGDSTLSNLPWTTSGATQPVAGLGVPSSSEAGPMWDLFDYTTPTSTPSGSWTGEWSADGTVFASISRNQLDATKIYLSVKQGGTALVTRQLLGIKHIDYTTYSNAKLKIEVRLIVRSATDIWIFHVDESSAGAGDRRLYFSRWNGSAIASTTLLDLGTYDLLTFEVWQGTAGLSYLVYALRDLANDTTPHAGPVNGYAYLRTIDETTYALSSVIVTTPRLETGDQALGTYRGLVLREGDRLPSNRVFPYKGVNYLVHVFAGGVYVIFTYVNAAPSAVTLLRWGCTPKYQETVDGTTYSLYVSYSDSFFGKQTGIEYDPVSDTAFLVTMWPDTNSSMPFGNDKDYGRIYILRYWQALDDPTWDMRVDLLNEVPSYAAPTGSISDYEGDIDRLGYVPSRQGTGAVGFLLFQTKRVSAHYVHFVRTNCWHDPVTVEAELSFDLEPAIDVAASRHYDMEMVVDIGPNISTAGRRTRNTTWSTYWAQILDTSVNGEVAITLAPEIEVTGVLVIPPTGEVEIDFNTSLEISVAGESVRVFTMASLYPSIGVTFLEEFHQYMNAERADVWGLPPVQIMGYTSESLDVLKTVDIAQEHCDNMAATRWYAHGAAAFPPGWQTASERIRKAADVGAENLLYFSRYHSSGAQAPTAYEAWMSWKNSPPHYANMMTDWDTAGDPGDSAHVFSTLAFAFGPPPMYDGGGPPWDAYSIIELDPAVYNNPNITTFYGTDNFLIIKEAYVEAKLTENWQREALEGTLLRHSWERAGLWNIRAAHTASWSMPISAAHEVRYSHGVAAWHASVTATTTFASHETVISASVPLPGAAGFVAPYDMPLPRASSSLELAWSVGVAAAHEVDYEDVGRVYAAHTAPYTEYARASTSLSATYSELPKVVASLSSTYGDVANASAAFAAPYGDVPHVTTSLEAPYGQPVTVEAQHVSLYASQARVARQHQVSVLMGPRVQASYSGVYDMRQYNPVMRSITHGYSLLQHVPAAMRSPQSLVTINGRTIELDDGFVSCDYDAPGYTFQCAVHDLSFITGVKLGDRIDVLFEGTPYLFFLSGLSTSDAENSAAAKITLDGLSPVYRMDAPYAETSTYAPDSAKLFSEIIEEVLGVPVDFSRHIDWTVPFGRAQSTTQTPLAFVKSLLDTIGSRLLSTPMGSLLVLPRYPAGMDALPTSVPPHAFTEQENVFVRSSAYEYSRGYNRFRVRDSDAAYGDLIEFDKETSIVTVWPSPYRNSWRLECTTTPGVLLDSQGEVVQEQEEMWDFRSGTTNAKYPILDLVSLVWVTDSLGGVAFAPHSTKVTAPLTNHLGYGLAKVVYRTKCSKFLLTSSSPIEATQLLTVEM